MVSDCKNAEDFCAAANKYDRFHLKWKIDKDSKNETRLTCKDTLGNIHYLIAYKEDSGLPEIPTGNMITELRSRGYSVSVDKPEKIISKKDLGKLFQEAADTNQDELDFYSQLVSAGITVRDVFEYAGPEQADTMFRFCYDHGLLNEDRETEYVFRMICNLLSINESHSKYGFKLNDGEINCQSKEQAEVLSEFFEDLGFDAMPMQQNPDDTWQLYEEWKLM